MATYSPKRFSQPEFLKSIHPERLIALLDPHREFFKKQAMLLPNGRRISRRTRSTTTASSGCS